MMRSSTAHDLQRRLVDRVARVAACELAVQRVTVEGVSSRWGSLGRIAVERIVLLRRGCDWGPAERLVAITGSLHAHD
jgi:hypothetical protein